MGHKFFSGYTLLIFGGFYEIKQKDRIGDGFPDRADELCRPYL
jgi:hypothetical protein